ncbi:MAG: alkaline phosphatase family protein [Candidatus Micrarchaeota archaeon]
MLVVLDGIGDLPCRALNGKTPLESAKKPNLDFLASKSKTGCINIAGNIAPGSDTGVFAVLGFNPFPKHAGRGALEAVGAGLPFENGWLASRANFATSDESGVKLLDVRVGGSLATEESKLLGRELNEKVKLGVPFVFKSTVAYRGIVVFKAKGFSKEISNTNPAYAVGKDGKVNAQSSFEKRILESKPLVKTREAAKAASVVNEFTRKAHKVLQESEINKKRVLEGKLPANAILMRGAETKLEKVRNLVPGFHEMRWALLADMPLEVGIAKFVGMIAVPLPTPTFGASDYPIRARKTIEVLKKYDAVYVHLKGPDIFAHVGDAKGKKKSIEEIDEFYFKPLLKKIDLGTVRIAVTADHSTPCDLKAHSADSVPYLISGLGKGGTFDETHCRKTKPIPAREIMKMLLHA